MEEQSTNVAGLLFSAVFIVWMLCGTFGSNYKYRKEQHDANKNHY